MNFKQILFFLFFASHTLFADNFRTQLVIPSVNIQNPIWAFEYQKIHQKEDGIFAKVVEKWNEKLVEIYEQFDNQMYQEIELTIDQIEYILNDPLFIKAYVGRYQQWYDDIISDQYVEEIEPAVLSFIKNKLSALKINKNVRFNVVNHTSLLVTSFGTDRSGHYLVFHKDFYNTEKLLNVFKAIKNNVGFFYIQSHINFRKSLSIEYENFLEMGITQSMSNVIHQSDFFVKTLQILVYDNKSLTKKTIRFASDCVLFQSYLESCLQSKNPVEAALFMKPQLNELSRSFIILWKEFIKDLKNCYDPQDLEHYETTSLADRKKAFTDQREYQN